MAFLVNINIIKLYILKYAEKMILKDEKDCNKSNKHILKIYNKCKHFFYGNYYADKKTDSWYFCQSFINAKSI